MAPRAATKPLPKVLTPPVNTEGSSLPVPDGLIGWLHYLSPKQTGELLGIATQTLASLRRSGEGPVFVKLGPKRVAYLYADIIAWLESRRRRSTSDFGPEGR